MANRHGHTSPEIALQARAVANVLRKEGKPYAHIATVINDMYDWPVTKQSVGRWFDNDTGELIPAPIDKPVVNISHEPTNPIEGYRRITAESLDLNAELKATIANAFETIAFVFTYARAYDGQKRANFTQYAIPHMNAVARLLDAIPKDETKGKEALEDDPMDEYLASMPKGDA